MRRLTLAVLVLVVSVACATNPVSGKKELSLMSEAEELAIGQQADAEIRREMGVYDNQELQRYVSDIGMRLARQSHRPNLPWTFTVVDSPAINAFAVPGGYVYITRGILPYLEDEAELAGVLGHEIGHVTARHASQQYSRQAAGGIGLAVLSIFVPQAAPFQDVSSMGLGVLFLKYGRDDELESDRLGMEYASANGWDPAAVPRFLSTLARVERHERARCPELAVHAPRSRLPCRRRDAGRREVRVRQGDHDERGGLRARDRRCGRRRQPRAGHRSRQRVPASADAHRPRVPRRLGSGEHARSR